jgi:hypothetical protein
MTARSQKYLARLKESGGQIVPVRMTREQLLALDACRFMGNALKESRSACVNRLVAENYLLRRMDSE